jgi:hypothetical protein
VESGEAGNGENDPDEEDVSSPQLKYGPDDEQWHTGIDDVSEGFDDESEGGFEDDEDGVDPDVAELSEDSVEREVVLVALEAAALSRRIFPSATRRRDLSVEGRQALLAVALVDPSAGLTAHQLAHVLAIDREAAVEALAELVAFGLAGDTELWDPNDGEEDEDAAYGITARGREVALEVAVVAKRFLPGWPPRHR